MRTVTAALLLIAVWSCRPREQPQAMDTNRAGSPLALVREYVDRDARGERLRSAPWFLSVVGWPEEPAFDSYTVIATYQVGQLAPSGDSAIVPVTYQRLGWIETTGRHAVRFVIGETIERYDFRLGVREGRWLIGEPRLEPHVLADTALAKAPLSASDRDMLQARLSSLRRQ